MGARAVFAEAFEPSASLRQEIVASSSTEIETTHAEMLPLVGTPVCVDVDCRGACWSTTG